MAELGVYNNAERERLREALRQFKVRHGNIGDFKLHNLMHDILDPQHLVYLSQSTMQRFLRGKGRSTDEAVWAVKTFLDRVTPRGGADKLARSFADQMSSAPVATVPPVFKSIQTYQGRYETYLAPYSGKFFETEFEAPHGIEFILFPAADPRYLQVWMHNPNTEIPAISWSFFLRCGAYQFLLMSTGLGGNASFILLSHMDDEPLMLQGTMLQTANEWPPEQTPYDIRLVRVQRPDPPMKRHTGQYGRKTKSTQAK